MSEKQTRKTESNDKNDRPSLLEWLASIIGAILVAGAIGFLLINAFKETVRPPDLVVEKEKIVEVTNGFLVKFSLVNKGDANAAAVTVEGKLMNGETEIETSSTTLSYAPSNSKREGGLLFTRDPNQFKLQLRAAGYENP